MTAPHQSSVRAMDITVRFGKFVALDTVSISLEAGRIVGLVGPNGAGKTTLMRVLTGLVIPQSGSVTVCGIDVLKSSGAARRKFGYLPDASGLYPDMRVTEYLDFFSAAYGLSKAAARAFQAKALDLSGLADKSSEFVETLSLGMRAKLSFVKILAHDPSLLLLDEPLSGLDPMALSDMLALLSRLKDEGKTILISSHLLSNLEKLCDDIIFLNQGKIITDKPADGHSVYRLRVRGDVSVRETGGELVGAEVLSISGTDEEDIVTIELRFSVEVDPAEVLREIVGRGIGVLEWRPVVEGLDARLMRMVRREQS